MHCTCNIRRGIKYIMLLSLISNQGINYVFNWFKSIKLCLNTNILPYNYLTNGD